MIKSNFYILFALLFLLATNVFAADGSLPSHSDSQINELYSTSYQYFEAGRYARAAEILGQIASYRSTNAKRHSEILLLADRWSQPRAHLMIGRMEKFGLDRDKAMAVYCREVIKQLLYLNFKECAKEVAGFSDAANRRLERLLDSLSSKKHVDIPELVWLVNENELTGSRTDDLHLLRTRVRARIDSYECCASNRYRNMDLKFFAPYLASHIYGR